MYPPADQLGSTETSLQTESYSLLFRIGKKMLAWVRKAIRPAAQALWHHSAFPANHRAGIWGLAMKFQGLKLQHLQVAELKEK